jgi:hypothetical protein
MYEVIEIVEGESRALNENAWAGRTLGWNISFAGHLHSVSMPLAVYTLFSVRSLRMNARIVFTSKLV